MQRLKWSRPCASCGNPCDKEATHCRPCAIRLRTWSKKPRPVPSEAQVRPRVLFELYCLMCGRGTGHCGELIVTPQPPTRRLQPCRWCGGFVLLRQFGDDLTTLPNPRTIPSHVRKVA